MPLALGAAAILGNALSFTLVNKAQKIKTASEWKTPVHAAWSDFMLKNVASRDFSVVVLVFAFLGKLEWFLWIAAIGSIVFAVIMVWVLRPSAISRAQAHPSSRRSSHSRSHRFSYRSWQHLRSDRQARADGAARHADSLPDHVRIEAYGWKVTLGPSAHHVPFWRLLAIRTAGEVVNMTTPTAYVGGEPLRPIYSRSTMCRWSMVWPPSSSPRRR